MPPRPPWRGERDGEDGIGAQLGLGLGAVELEHDAVNRQLVEGVHAAERGKDFLGHVLDGLGDAFAAVSFLVAVAQFEGFVLAGAGARRHRRAAHRAAGKGNVNFHCGITA